MGIRTFFYRVLFLSLLYGNTVLASTDDQNAVIPPIIVKKPHPYSVTSAPETIITQQDMTNSGATSLSQALQELGGVQLEDTSGNNSQVLLSMRGFGANANSNTLLLINGIPLSNPDLMPPDLNAIPLQEIAYIEIINGSESVLYGDQAVGGIINIVTRHDLKDKIEVSCAGGSYNTRNCYATLNNHVKKLYYNISLLNNHTDNYRVNNDYDQTLLSGNTDYHYNSGSLKFDYKIINERMQYPGALTAAEVDQNRRQAETSNDVNFFKDWNGLFSLRQKQQFGDRFELQTDLSRREMHGSGVLSTPFTQSRYIYFVKPQLKGTFGKLISTNGIELDADQYYLNSLSGVTNNGLQKYGLYTIADIAATPRLSFSAGARDAQQNNYPNTQNSTINRAFATTLGTTYQLTPATKVYLRRAESFRFPNADENAFTPIGVNGLKTQKGVAYESGVQWDFKRLMSKISIFQLNLVNEIAYDPTQTPSQPFGSNRNYDPTTRYGSSVSGKYQVTDKLALDGQYNYVNARFQSGPNAGNRIPLVAENILHTGLNFHFLPNWNIYTEAIYTGNQYSDNDDANTAGRMGGYTTYNMNVRFQYHQFSASFRLNNIFNKYYYLYTVLDTFSNTQFFYPAPARNFMLTLKYLFN